MIAVPLAVAEPRGIPSLRQATPLNAADRKIAICARKASSSSRKAEPPRSDNAALDLAGAAGDGGRHRCHIRLREQPPQLRAARAGAQLPVHIQDTYTQSSEALAQL